MQESFLYLLNNSILCDQKPLPKNVLKVFAFIFENSHLPLEFSGSATAPLQGSLPAIATTCLQLC